MKFVGLNSTSYDIVLGWKGSPNPKKNSVKFRTFNDGGLSILNMGARIEHTAEFKIINLEKTEFYTLVDYFIAQAGNKVSLRYENLAEKLWVDVDGTDIGGGVGEYYVYILEPSSFQEEDFSITDELYTLTLKVALAGIESTSVPNEDNTSTNDILIQIDTIHADFIQSDEPTGTYAGQRWLDTDDRKLYEFDGTSWGSNELYIVTADNSTYGWKNGSFYLSAFSTLTYNGDVYKAGLINFKSVKAPNKSVNINQGPSIERLDGFNFSVNSNYNNSKFWKWLMTNNIGFFGNKCIIGFIQGGTYTKLGTGINNKSNFDYTSYGYNPEPFALNKNDKMPSTTIENSNTRYADTKTKLTGKAPYVTYGEFDQVALQNISSERSIINVESRGFGDDEYISAPTIIAQVNYNDTTEVYIHKAQADGMVQYLISQTIIDDLANQIYTLSISDDTKSGSANPDSVRQILSIDDSSDPNYYILTLDEALEAPDQEVSGGPPNAATSITMSLSKVLYQFQIDENICGGFGENVNDEFENFIDVLGIEDSGEDFKSLPFSEFRLNINNNKLLMVPKISQDVGKVDVFKPVTTDIEPIQRIPFQDISQGSSAAVDINAQMPDITLRPPAWDRNVLDESYRPMGRGSAGRINNKFDYMIYTAFFEGTNSDKGYTVVPSTDLQSGKMKKVINITNWGSLTSSEAMGDDQYIIAMRFPVNHSDQDSTFENSTNIKLCLNLRINSYIKSNPENYTNARYRYGAAAFKVIIRFRTKGGTYIDNSSWEHAFEANELGFPSSTRYKDIGNMELNNFPDGDSTGGFKETTTSFPNGFDHQITYKQIQTDPLDTTNRGDPVDGDKLWDTAFNKLWEYNGTSWSLWNTDGIVTEDTYILEQYEQTNGRVTADLWVVESGALVIVPQVDRRFPKFEGRDIFDLSSEPFGASSVWNTVTDLEVLIVNQAFNNSENPFADFDKDDFKNFRWHCEINWRRSPKLFYTENLEVIDRPLLAPLRGRTFYENKTLKSGANIENELELVSVIDTDVVPKQGTIKVTSSAGVVTEYEYTSYDNKTFVTTIAAGVYSGGEIVSVPEFSSDPEKIVTDIMDSDGMYPNRWDTTSITTLMAFQSRQNWSWRRQFTKAMKTQDMLQELLDNLWACAITDVNDNLVLKSMIPRDYPQGSVPVNRRFTDTNIILDSLTPPQFRKVDEIFTEFHLDYDYAVASEFSSAIKKYNNSVTIDKNTGSTGIQRYIKISQDIYNIKNSFKKGFKYHYNDLSISEDIAEWYVLNVWQFEFKTIIENILGDNALTLLEYISVTSDFFTDNQAVEGFVTKIKPDLYEGVVTIGVHVFRPPGVFGPLCDNFNDASTTDRDISGWSSSQKNDAGDTTRNIGDYTLKDAGTVPRTLTC